MANRLLVTTMVLGASLGIAEAGPAANEDIQAKIQTLEQTIASQGARIAELEGQKFLTREDFERAAAGFGAAAPNDFRFYWKDGLRMDTRDDSMKMKFGGRLMADFGWIDGTGLEDDLGVDLEDGTEVRRARLYFAGTIGRGLEFKLQTDLAGGDADLKDAYLKFKKLPVPGSIKVGHFKEPFSLEELTSSKYITFMERSLANVFSPGRNMGIMAAGACLDSRTTWAIGLFRANSDDYCEDDVDGESAITARVTGLPLYADGGKQMIHLGASYSHRRTQDPIRYRQRPEAHFLAHRFTDSGAFSADGLELFGAEAAWVCGPFSLQSEVMAASADASDGNKCTAGFYVEGSYFLTGEHRKYKTSAGAFSRVKPNHSYGDDGGWGAWQVAARYSYLDLDESGLSSSAREMQNLTLGLNWHLNPNVRIMANYIRSCVEGVDVSDYADIFMMRVQVDF